MLFTLPAQLGPEIMPFLIPITAIVMGIGAGIVKVLTRHQQAMAEIMNRPRQDDSLIHEIRALRGEVAELRDRVNQQVIDRDAYSQQPQLQQAPPPVPSEIEQRLRQF